MLINRKIVNNDECTMYGICTSQKSVGLSLFISCCFAKMDDVFHYSGRDSDSRPPMSNLPAGNLIILPDV